MADGAGYSAKAPTLSQVTREREAPGATEDLSESHSQSLPPPPYTVLARPSPHPWESLSCLEIKATFVSCGFLTAAVAFISKGVVPESPLFILFNLDDAEADLVITTSTDRELSGESRSQCWGLITLSWLIFDIFSLWCDKKIWKTLLSLVWLVQCVSEQGFQVILWFWKCTKSHRIHVSLSKPIL